MLEGIFKILHRSVFLSFFFSAKFDRFSNLDQNFAQIFEKLCSHSVAWVLFVAMMVIEKCCRFALGFGKFKQINVVVIYVPDCWSIHGSKKKQQIHWLKLQMGWAGTCSVILRPAANFHRHSLFRPEVACFAQSLNAKVFVPEAKLKGS